MPDGSRRKSKLTKITLFKVTLLLVQIFLIKIGQFPIFLVKSLSTIREPRRLLRLKVPAFRPHPGRPRKQWFLSYYLKKFRLFIKRRVPKKTKIAVALSFIIVFVILYTQLVISFSYQLPSPERITQAKPTTTEILDRNSKLLYRIYEGANRSIVKFEELPKHLVDATTVAEDKNFYSHPGVDFTAILRALYHNFRYKTQEGASTITQQLIKNTLLTSEKTYRRKIKEIILSLWIESKYSKNEILQMYFNEAPYGGPNWGIKAATRFYFDKELKDLTLTESAYLAGLPASPTQFSPYGITPGLGIEKSRQILKRMLDQKLISDSQYNQAQKEQLSFKSPNQDIKAPHFVFYIRDILAKEFGEKVISEGGLKIITTLDLGLQKEVEKIVSEEITKLAPLHVQNGAAMVLDAKTSQILSMVGSRDYFYPGFGNFNATLALRQPGSSIKPITYATAFKEGYFPGNTILDTQASFKDGDKKYSPVNYDGSYHGPVSLRVALGSSYNVPAVKLLSSVGIEDMIQTARDLGITSFDDTNRFGLSLTLGGGEVRLIEMMGVYQTFSQMGAFQKPTGILKVTDSQGNILKEYEENPKQVLQSEIAYLITNVLSDNKARTPSFGPNSLLNIKGNQVAVKTGTSDNKRDNLTFGYTEDFVVGVWVGNNDNTPMNPSLASGITGAAPIWNRIIKGILAEHPSISFTKPEGIIEAQIDGRKDLAISGFVPKGLVKVRNEADKTIFFDSFSSYATQSAVTRLPLEKIGTN